jgi:hypothetical protein
VIVDPRERVVFSVGDKVIKDKGDYRFHGTVVATFRKLSGAVRYIVEDNRGLLLIYSAANIRLQP